jgi:magnesium transporter
MIKFMKTTENGIEQLTEVVNNCWVQVVDPNPEEMRQLKELGLPYDFITYPLDIDERARSEREDDGTLLIIVRVPIFQGMISDIPYSTMPLGIIVTDKFIVTISRQDYSVIQQFAEGRMRGFSTAKRYRFILRILHDLATDYLAKLREISRATDGLEDKLQSSMKNKEVLELLKYQKSLVVFNQGIKSNEVLIERLQRMKIFTQYDKDEDLLEDVITENQQALGMIDISTNILNSMMDAFASIISNNLNVVMKFLASMTIILSIPTIVTSFFGMNVGLPMADHPLAYLWIIVLFVAICAGVVILFLKRDWF